VQELCLELYKCLADLYSETVIVELSLAHLIGVDVDGFQVLDHLLDAGEAHLGLVVVAGLEVLLSIASSAIKEVEHFGLLVFKMVGVYAKLPLHPELPALKGRVHSV
jgi:hypothetical protein